MVISLKPGEGRDKSSRISGLGLGNDHSTKLFLCQTKYIYNKTRGPKSKERFCQSIQTFSDA